MKVLILDNYDSFTYNLAQYIGELGAEPIVIRNDVMPVEEALALAPDRVVISPGPGRPEDAGYSIDYIRAFGETTPTLGVCLGLQAAVVAYGGSVGLVEPKHGKTSMIEHDGRGIFADLENPFVATRYHSLAAVDVPEGLEVSARSEEGIVQGIRHRELPVTAVQFHPESVMTTEGRKLLANFLELTAAPVR
jgi:anthranilate synthase/aminodeoxychorismate synthase-like glutamine amidotransferase